MILVLGSEDALPASSRHGILSDAGQILIQVANS